MSKKKNMGLRKFQWFKISKSNSKTQCINLMKPKDMNNKNNLNSYELRFYHNSVDMNKEKTDHELYLFNLLESESEICDGNDYLYNVDRIMDDRVDSSLRDEAVKHLQIMNNVYFELPLDILCRAVQLIDRFITKVKVRPKYMFCATAVCYQIIVKDYNPTLLHPELMSDLPSISRSGGSSNDFIRMEDIIREKLYNQLHTITILDFVYCIFDYLSISHNNSMTIMKYLQPIIKTVVTNYSSGHQKPSIQAVACIILYNRWYPNQPICTALNLLHLCSLIKIDCLVVFNYVNLISELYNNNNNNRFNQFEVEKHFGHGFCNRRSGLFQKSFKTKLETIIEEW